MAGGRFQAKPLLEEPLRAHVLQHVPFEAEGSIASWLAGHGARVSRTALYEAPVFPALGDFDWLIVMGGPMSVNDETELPWLVAEKRFIADAVAQEKTVIGICLGAQLIAASAGARVFPNREREIGWFPVEPAGAADGAAALFAPRRDVFHWHGETFDLPAGARRLLRSEACENQAFALGSRVLGLQFHLETTPESARALISNCPGDLRPGPYVQSAGQMLAGPERFGRINQLMGQLLDALAQG